MRHGAAHFPTTTDSCTRSYRFSAFEETVTRPVIVPDAVLAKKGSVRLDESRRRAIETETVEHLRSNDPRSIDESRSGFESGIERGQRVMETPRAASPVPDRLQNRAIFLLRQAVGP